MKVQEFENFRAGLYSLGLGPEALQDKLWSHQDFPASNQNRITLLIIIQLLIHTLEGKHEISDALKESVYTLRLGRNMPIQ